MSSSMRIIAFIIVAIALLVPASAFASRASHDVMTLRQPDGTTISVLLHGDERFNYYTTLDGRPLLREPDGRMVLSTWETVLRQAREEMTAQEQTRAVESYPDENLHFFPHTGQPRVCVILMEFPEVPFTYSPEDICEWLNGEQHQYEDPSVSYSSVAGYFDFCSQGQFRPVFDVYGPYQTPQEASYYGYSHGSNTSFRRLVADALEVADADVDFAQYDNYYDDGRTDLVYVIFSGAGANSSGDISQPWPIAGHTSVGPYDGVSVYCCGISSELSVRGGKVCQAGIGVFCHEMSHVMGLPDLYDTNGTMPDWDNNGPEAWDLMDDGENIFTGMWPMPYTAWERDLFDWIDLVELTDPEDVTLYPLNDPLGRGYACKITNPENANEYYTLEVIPQTEQYSWLSQYGVPGGLLMTHVNFNASLFAGMRVNNTYGSPNLTIVPADGLLLSSASIGKDRVIDGKGVRVDGPIYRANLGGDPFPGTQGVHSVSAYHNYAGQPSMEVGSGIVDMAEAFPITDIQKHADGSVSFKFRGGTSSSVSVQTDNGTLSPIYNMEGCYCGTDLGVLPAGIYIVDGVKIEKK